MSIQIIVVDKTGLLKEQKVKWSGIETLYKKAGFKSDNGFKQHTNWEITVENKPYNIEVYGKTNGRAGQENKYDFPPPIDKELFFGNVIIINRIQDEVVSLNMNEWGKIYNKLFGGFEDINVVDSSESEDEQLDLPKTKSGYYKDGFIVDSDDGNDITNDSESESDSSYEKPSKKTNKTTKTTKTTKTKEPENKVTKSNNSSFDKLIESANELCKEDYI